MPKVKYRMVLDTLRNVKQEDNINHQIISNYLGGNPTANALANRYHNDGYLTEEEYEVIKNKFGYDFLSNTSIRNRIETDNNITLDYYPDIEVSCGNGLIPFGETKEKITVPTSFINGFSKSNRYFIVNAISDSMMPEIKPKDLLILRQIDNEPIIDNHIYVFCHEDRLYCKYLSYNVGQVIVRSANKDYPIRYIEGEKLQSFSLIGEVCGHFRNYLI